MKSLVSRAEGTKLQIPAIRGGSYQPFRKHVMENLIKDIKFGLRGLLKQPGFSLLVVATLALGIGASTAIFSVVNSVLLNKLPYGEASRIVAIQELDPKGSRGQITSANFLDWRKQNT